MTTHEANGTAKGVIDSGMLWILGAGALYFAMQLWILPKLGVST